MQLRLGNWEQGDSNPISVHKILPQIVKLLPKSKEMVTVLVYPKMEGTHVLDSLKVLDLQKEHLIDYSRVKVQVK